MDSFEVRMQFADLVERLNSTQFQIQRTVQFMRKYENQSEEAGMLFDVILQEFSKKDRNGAYINRRVYLFGLLQAYVDSTSTQQQQQQSSDVEDQPYMQLLRDNLVDLCELAIPKDHPIGVSLNAPVLTSILTEWKGRQCFRNNTQLLDACLSLINDTLSHIQPQLDDFANLNKKMSKAESLKRIEQDRERHKRRKEDAWMEHTLNSDTINPLEYEFDMIWNGVDPYNLRIDGQTFQKELALSKLR
ncbi:hypothetical protein MIR68_004797 [Amoeboaphelidium protococcarum]|nr:hypothetical protein MIR68_004797 [Amoeboaphelidium protococcarum]